MLAIEYPPTRSDERFNRPAGRFSLAEETAFRLLLAASDWIIQLRHDTVQPFSGFDRQSEAVGAATNAVVARLCAEHRPSVIEGIHAAPGFLSRTIGGHPTKPIVIERLMVEPDVKLHRQRLAHRSHAESLRRGDRGLAEFPTIRAIQAHLIEQAEANDVTVVDSSGLGELTQSIVDEIVSSSGGDDDVT